MEKQFLNREGTQDNLEYYNEEGVLIYEFYKYKNYEEFEEYTYDDFGNRLSGRFSYGYWWEITMCKETGKKLIYKNSIGEKRGVGVQNASFIC